MSLDRIQVRRAMDLGLQLTIYDQLMSITTVSCTTPMKCYVLYRRQFRTCATGDSQTLDDEILASICTTAMLDCQHVSETYYNISEHEFNVKVDALDEEIPRLPVRGRDRVP